MFVINCCKIVGFCIFVEHILDLTQPPPLRYSSIVNLLHRLTYTIYIVPTPYNLLYLKRLHKDESSECKNKLYQKVLPLVPLFAKFNQIVTTINIGLIHVSTMSDIQKSKKHLKKAYIYYKFVFAFCNSSHG